jgi:hypothetical protein
MQNLDPSVHIHILRLCITNHLVCSLTKRHARAIVSLQMLQSCTDSPVPFKAAYQCLHTSSILSLHVSIHLQKSITHTRSNQHNEVCCHCCPDMRQSLRHKSFKAVLSVFILAHKGVHARLCEGHIGHPHQISLLHFALLILIHQLQNLQAITDLS